MTAAQTASDLALEADLGKLIHQQHQAAAILLRIAQREEYDAPVTAVRAAASAARVLSDTVAAFVVEERIADLQAEVGKIRQENLMRSRQGRHVITPTEAPISTISGEPIKLPTWGKH